MRVPTFAAWVLGGLLAGAACADTGAPPLSGVDAAARPDAAAPWSPPLGASYEPGGEAVHVRVASTRASRLEAWFYDRPLDGAPVLAVELVREPDSDVFAARVEVADLIAAGAGDTLYYGVRAWGPNWAWDPAWSPGSIAGFSVDVDADGNRFNPNKLLIDPYTKELSHDPATIGQPSRDAYRVGDDWRAVDSGPVAPKSIVLPDVVPDVGARPGRALRDHVVYEVHLRGLTRGDPDAGPCAGTYAAAGERAADVAALGVTAIELLPVQETPNDTNDVVPDDAGGDNYWGYSTLAFFAPDRRYACDRAPGGPTREFQAMVRAFHAAGIEVWIDVVYNHTSEGGGGSLLSLRGLDNAAYYELNAAGTGFTDHTGIGADVDTTHPLAADLVIDSLRWWHDVLGVDGFRFDLASVLGDTCGPGCFDFEREGLLTRITEALPARGPDGGAGAIVVAEPWAIGPGTYQIGNFPAGWAEWNGPYRDLVRDDQNRLGVAAVTPGWLANRIAGSRELFGDDGRQPWHSINFVVAHDGFTLRDLYACNAKRNDQPWPLGPSSGGSNDNRSWDQAGDPARQRQAARTGLALLMLSAGVPMITGGDEAYRTQACNNNPYNLDSPAMWLDPADAVEHAAFATFARRLIAFRHAHPALRPATWWTGAEVTWHRADGSSASGAYMDDASQHVLGWRVRGAAGSGEPARSIYVLYNGWSSAVRATLPPRADDARWYRVADTAAWLEDEGNFHAPGDEYAMQGVVYDLAARSLAVFVER